MDVLVDSNVILRRIHRTHPQHREARDAIARFSKDRNRICVTSQNLVEVWAVLTRPPDSNGLGLSPSQSDRVLARIESAVFRLPDLDDVFPVWRRLVVEYGISGKPAHDARLVAAMIAHGIAHILTFNTADFVRFAGIEVLHSARL